MAHIHVNTPPETPATPNTGDSNTKRRLPSHTSSADRGDKRRAYTLPSGRQDSEPNLPTQREVLGEAGRSKDTQVYPEGERSHHSTLPISARARRISMEQEQGQSSTLSSFGNDARRSRGGGYEAAVVRSRPQHLSDVSTGQPSRTDIDIDSPEAPVDPNSADISSPRIAAPAPSRSRRQPPTPISAGSTSTRQNPPFARRSMPAPTWRTSERDLRDERERDRETRSRRRETLDLDMDVSHLRQRTSHPSTPQQDEPSGGRTSARHGTRPTGLSTSAPSRLPSPPPSFSLSSGQPLVNPPAKTQAAFVGKLYSMLEDETITKTGLIHWSEDGKMFVCPNPIEFAK